MTNKCRTWLSPNYRATVSIPAYAHSSTSCMMTLIHPELVRSLIPSSSLIIQFPANFDTLLLSVVLSSFIICKSEIWQIGRGMCSKLVKTKPTRDSTAIRFWRTKNRSLVRDVQKSHDFLRILDYSVRCSECRVSITLMKIGGSYQSKGPWEIVGVVFFIFWWRLPERTSVQLE